MGAGHPQKSLPHPLKKSVAFLFESIGNPALPAQSRIAPGRLQIQNENVRGPHAVAGYLFILPNFLGFAVFTLIPVILSLVLSFVSWDMLSSAKFIVLHNFINHLGYHK